MCEGDSRYLHLEIDIDSTCDVGNGSVVRGGPVDVAPGRRDGIGEVRSSDNEQLFALRRTDVAPTCTILSLGNRRKPFSDQCESTSRLAVESEKDRGMRTYHQSYPRSSTRVYEPGIGEAENERSAGPPGSSRRVDSCLTQFLHDAPCGIYGQP